MTGYIKQMTHADGNCFGGVNRADSGAQRTGPLDYDPLLRDGGGEWMRQAVSLHLLALSPGTPLLLILPVSNDMSSLQ